MMRLPNELCSFGRQYGPISFSRRRDHSEKCELLPGNDRHRKGENSVMVFSSRNKIEGRRQEKKSQFDFGAYWALACLCKKSKLDDHDDILQTGAFRIEITC